MGREERRGKTGWWLLALIGLILTAAGIRYASSTEWWANTFDRQEPNFQTINTGTSIQVATSVRDQGTGTIQENVPRPGQIDNDASTTPQQPGRRMW